MADRTFRCKLITPEERVIDAEVTYARVPLWDGKTGVMHHTSAFVGKIGFGELRLEFPQGTPKSWFIDGGFVQNVNDEVTILANGAIPTNEIDLTEAKAELAEATARIPNTPDEMDRITAARTRARAKVAVAGG